MPTLTINGARHCPKCSRAISKHKAWPFLVCKFCITWEASRPKHQDRIDRRVRGGTPLSPMLHKYQRTPAPRLGGPATLTLDDIPLEGKNFLARMFFSVESLEALSKPFGHAVYEAQLEVERNQGRGFHRNTIDHGNRAGAMSTNADALRGERLEENASENAPEPRKRRDSALGYDPETLRPCRGTQTQHDHTSNSGGDDAWRKTLKKPCLNCVRDSVAGRNVHHALADCPWIKQMMRRAVSYRLRQEGIEASRDDSDDDKALRRYRAASSMLDGTGQRVERKTGKIRANFGNCAQTPCLNCKKADHCLLECQRIVSDAHLRQGYIKFREAIAWVDALVAENASPRKMDSADSTKSNVEATTKPTSEPIKPTTEKQDWRARVLDEILHMEMQARPNPALEVARTVQKELETRLMDDVMTGDPQEGVPLSAHLLEVLLPRIEAMQR